MYPPPHMNSVQLIPARSLTSFSLPASGSTKTNVVGDVATVFRNGIGRRREGADQGRVLTKPVVCKCMASVFTHFRTHARTRSRSLSLSRALSLSLSHYLSLTHTHTQDL
jgi:hypothetical protein